MATTEPVQDETLATDRRNTSSSEDPARGAEIEKSENDNLFQTISWKRAQALIGLLFLIAISLLPFFLIGASLRIQPSLTS